MVQPELTKHGATRARSFAERHTTLNTEAVYKYKLKSNTSVAEQNFFFLDSNSGSTFVHNFGSGSSSCHILPLKTVLKLYYYKNYVSMEGFLHPSILQTDCMKYFLKG